MRTRHKPPTLVSMWMLDVFCCALGCVTLLWLMNTRQAADNATKAGAALERLATTEADLSARQAELLATQTEAESTRRRLTAELEELQGKLLALTAERDDTAKTLALAQGDLAAATKRLTAASARVKSQDDELAKKRTAAADLQDKLAASTKAADDAADLLRRKAVERSDLETKLNAAARQGADAKSQLASARGTIRDLSRKNETANATIIDLQGQKAKLADKLDRLQTEADARFAGIALTGRRVCFVVDTSGSMKLLDEHTPAADKWGTVVDTVGRVMRSLTDLQAYQVVVFGRDAGYLFGTADWQPYRGEESVRRVADALRKTEPKGDTNLHAAFDLAFKLRPGGLDTVYLFSDGLPTSGPALTPAEDRSLVGPARTDKLARHLRQTLADDWNRRRGDGRVRVHAVGFFYESPEVGAFLWALARENDGSFVGMSRP
jgi:predicted  nucleic acid-binding Zn-ribbon protein